MRRKSEGTWFWNTGQVNTRRYLALYLLVLCTSAASARPDFLDSMSRQFFGAQNDDNRQTDHHQHRQDPDPFSQMFGSHSQPVPSRPPPPPPNRQYKQRPPQRQGYYAPHPVAHHPQYQAHPPQNYPNYNGPPPVYGQQQGFGQVKTDGNETKTEGFPRDGSKHPPATRYKSRHPHVSPEYHIQHQPAEYHHQPVEYHHQEPVEYHHQPPVEYHHAPPHQVEYHQPAVVEEHHGVEIHPDPHHHPHHEVVEYHHAPPVEYHHPTHKPKRFHISFNQPSPDLKIIDKHLKIPPVKFRFHINPKILITTNTKDPLDKKHHDDEHDLEPFPPPDAFSDHEAPPSYSEHTIEHYPVAHHEHYPVAHHEHYPVAHEVVKHYPVAYPEAKHYPVEHHAVAHHPSPHGYTYDLSGGHSHLNPHRSSGHYEPTFKIKTRPIVFTEPYPTRPTTTPRPSTTTSRTTTTTTTTTARPTRSRSRARLNARNPGFSVAFTQASTTATTSIDRQGGASEASTSTTRRSIFGSNSEREKEGEGISARKDDRLSSTTSIQTSTASTTSTSPKTTISTTTTPASTTTLTTTTTTPKPTTTTTTTTQRPTTTTTTTTTERPTTASTTTTTAAPTTTTTTTTRAPPTTRLTNTPAEETTPRTTPTLNVGANEIDMQKASESPRRRPEPLKEESLTTIERSERFNVESSESVKIIETTMLIDGKNQTVKFYYITQPVKLPLDLFQKMTGQKANSNGMSVVKIRDKRFVMNLNELEPFLRD